MEGNPLLSPLENLWNEAFEVYKAHWWAFLGIFAVAMIPYVLFLPITISTIFVVGKDPSPNMPSLMVIVSFAAMWLLINLLTGTWAISSAIYAIKERAQKPSVPHLLKKGWSVLPSCLWISFLAGVMIMCGLVLLIIPGIALMTWFGFALYAFAFEGMKGVDALQRSSDLVKGYWRAIFGRVALVVAAFVAVPAVFTPFFSTLITLFFVTPMAIIYMYLLYEDVKRVKSAI